MILSLLSKNFEEERDRKIGNEHFVLEIGVSAAFFFLELMASVNTINMKIMCSCSFSMKGIFLSPSMPE